MLAIVFKNPHFCVVHKPVGWLSVPARTGEKDPRPVVGRVLEQELSARVWPCHRLDEEVSGLLVFALTAEAHRAANGWFERHEVLKTYEAFSERKDDDAHYKLMHEWSCRLMRGKKRAYEAEFGKDSLTKVWIHEVGFYRDLEIAVWRLQPWTGRAHQLRYEMFRHGRPILGDDLYGSQLKFHAMPDGIALQAFLLDFAKCAEIEKFSLPGQLELPAEHRLQWDTLASTD